MSIDYARQKSRDALDSLTSEGGMAYRLTNAAMALVGFPTEHLPSAQAREAKVVENAFVSWPASWPTGQYGAAELLMRMIPEQRRRELVEKVINLHESLCRLEGATSSQPRAPRAPSVADVVLDGTDRWEFLYWNLGHNDAPELLAKYVRYAQAFLPNFPPDALLEWPGRHGYQSLRRWGFLPLERLVFVEETWSLTELARIQSHDQGFTAIGPNSHGAGHVSREGDWTANYIRSNGTWSKPILVLSCREELSVGGRTFAPGYALIEGHTRLSRMLNMPVGERDEAGHRVLVVSLPE